MKKMLLASFVLLSLTYTSCKKDHTCTCTQSINGSAAILVHTELIQDTKSKAESRCTEFAKTYNGYVKCEIR